MSREGLWNLRRKSGVAETYVRVVQEICEDCKVVARCNRGVEGGGTNASEISSEHFLVHYGDEQADRKS